MNDVYVENGYKNRKEYLQCLSEEYGVNPSIVWTLAHTLGPTEDFDGLLNALQDVEEVETDDDIYEDID